MRVIVQTPESNEQFPLEVDLNTRVEDLCHQVSGLFANVATTNLRKDYRVVYNGTPLFRGTLEDNQVTEGASLVALPVRKPRPVAPPEEEAAPSKKAIMQATSNSPSKNVKSPTRRSQLRHSLSSLWSELGVPHGAFSFPFSSLSSAPPIDNNQPITVNVDQNKLQQLTEMGFPEERAKKALIICRMNHHLAMEWLLEHSDDPEADQPLTQEQLRRLVPLGLTIPSSASTVPSTLSSSPVSSTPPPIGSSPSTPPSSAPPSGSGSASASASAPASSPASFTPDPTALQQLMEMGFSQENVVDALRLTNNNQEAACSYLLGDREEDAEETTSPFVRNILNHPIIQAGMANPRVLSAFRMMLDNPNTASQFIADPEVGPVIIEVHSILSNNNNNNNGSNPQ